MTSVALRRRLAELERRAEARLPDGACDHTEVWSWVPLPEREALEAELETAPDGSDAELAELQKAEAALLTAQTRRDAGWPRDWWARADIGKEPWR